MEALSKRDLRRTFADFDVLNMLLAHFNALKCDVKASALTDSIILDDSLRSSLFPHGKQVGLLFSGSAGRDARCKSIEPIGTS